MKMYKNHLILGILTTSVGLIQDYKVIFKVIWEFFEFQHFFDLKKNYA